MTTIFPAHTADTAPVEARRSVAATAAAFGFLPGPVARMAEAPALLEGFLTTNRLFQGGVLAPLEREVVVLTVARRNRCHYCMAMHTALLERDHAAPELVAALRSGTDLPDARLEAVARFTSAVLDHAGAVPDDDVRAFVEAGFSPRAALEVVLGVGATTLSTLANRLTGAPLDTAYETSAWDEGELVLGA